MCPHDISIHTNLYQNHSINGIKVVLYDLGSRKNLLILNDSIHIIFIYQSRFLNECARKEKAKIP